VTTSTSASGRAAAGPLDGVRVLDLGNPMALYGTKLLADLGADVLLVEPPGGVAARHLPPYYHDQGGPATSLSFWFVSTSKRSVTCNLDTVDGRALFQRLVDTAQVVVAGTHRSHLAALGLDYEHFSSTRPDLIWASVSGFGDWGPHAGWLAPDLVGVAMSGIMTLAGFPDRPPFEPPGNQGFLSAALQTAQGILLALRIAERQGKGQLVEVSMQEALSLSQETSMQYWDMQRVLRKRTGGGALLLPGVGTYACADGYVYSMVGVTGFGAPWPVLAAWMNEMGMAADLLEESWQAMLGSMNLRELTRLLSEPERLAELKGRFDHVDEVLGRFYARHPKQYLYEEGQRRRLLIGPVNSPKDLVENKQLLARGWFQKVHHPELGDTIAYPGPPFRMEKSPWRIARRPPLVGEHNAAVWGEELGYDRRQLAVLAAAGSI